MRCDPEGVWKWDGALKPVAEEIGLTREAPYRALAKSGSIARDKLRISLMPVRSVPA